MLYVHTHSYVYIKEVSILLRLQMTHAMFQVEVYQADFNAERQAREKIAGEKADLVEEIRRIKNGQPAHMANAIDEVCILILSSIHICMLI